ncbi:hypothetical protein [Rickettsia endosymbiont of Cantharis rufa]|uniref:hypothetical protein n=1 Tax=Rickettsia endosymbiont of Cantharis rufa TaxID=3066248 RepID=UPI0031333983
MTQEERIKKFKLQPMHGTTSVGSILITVSSFVSETMLLSQVKVIAVFSAIFCPALRGRTSILQMWILKGYTFNKSSDDFIMNIQ